MLIITPIVMNIASDDQPRALIREMGMLWVAVHTLFLTFEALAARRLDGYDSTRSPLQIAVPAFMLSGVFLPRCLYVTTRVVTRDDNDDD